MAERLAKYAMPTFTEHEQAFLRCYARSLDRVAAMQESQLAYSLQLSPRDTAGLELAATAVIRKAEALPLHELATAIGADKLAMVQRIWCVCLSDEAHKAVKGLQILARIHGVYDDKRALGAGSVAIVLGTPEPLPSATPPGLPFTLDVTPEATP